METLTLANGYDRKKTPSVETYRAMTAEEARALSCGAHVWFLGNNGKAYNAKVNGAVKTWKRTPARVEVSLKYGMYECFTDSARADGTMGMLLVRLD